MILIWGDKKDFNNKYLISWLKYYNQKYIFINRGTDTISIEHIDINTGEFFIHFSEKNKTLSSKEINAIWIRGGRIQIKDFVYNPDTIKSQKTVSDKIFCFLSMYYVSQHEYITNKFSKNNQVGKDGVGRFNKLLALESAKKIGFNIPNTIVTTKKKDVVEFYKKNKRIITKSLDNNLDFSSIEGKWFHQYTSEVTSSEISNFLETFPLTPFQKLIPKTYEIRTFYINGKCFSRAIFSQNDTQTSIDYRRYNYERMNRFVPFKFKPEFENRIKLLMDDLNLHTGSLDFMRADNKFYFLEVNPVGQFGMVSYPCNYNIEKKIAKILSHE